MRRAVLQNLDSKQRQFLASNQNRRRYRVSEVKDLVLLRRVIIDKKKSHKLEPRWSEPYLLVRKDRSEQTEWIASLADPNKKMKRRHVHHMRVYCPREKGLRNV
jgi:hypothetical protein